MVEICYNNEVGAVDPSIIPDNQMSASTQYNDSTQAAYGRLNDNRGDGWCARDATGTNDWLQVDFNRTILVCGVATQGDNGGALSAWVKSFQLSFSSDGSSWTTYAYADKELVRFDEVQVILCSVPPQGSTENDEVPIMSDKEVQVKSNFSE